MCIFYKKLLHTYLVTAFFCNCYAADLFNKFESVLPAQIGNTTSNLYFGMHIHNLALSPEQSNTKLTTWPEKTQISSIRLWDTRTRWAEIEPRPNEWNFDRMDNIVELAMSHNASIVYVFGSTPIWASSRPTENCPYGKGCSAEPKNMSDWENYVRTVAQRYKGRITAYELWNEPFFSELQSRIDLTYFYTGSVTKMIDMARIARQVLDEIDPSAILTTPGFTGPSKQLELFLKSGGKEYIQVISSHFYASDSTSLARSISDVKNVMLAQGVQNLPLWNSEWGYLPSFELSTQDAAFKMSQFLIYGVFSGVQRNYFYAWDNKYMPGMVSNTEENSPLLSAYQKTQKWLQDTTIFSCQNYSKDALGCKGQQHGQDFIIVWSDLKDTLATILFPVDQKVLSIEKLSDETPIATTVSLNPLTINVGLEPIKILLANN